MSLESQARPLYRPLACWFCLPAFVFVLAPLLRQLGDTGNALAIVAVLTSASVGPVFTLFAVAVALVGHFTHPGPVPERLMWTVMGMAVAANLVVIFTGGGSRLLR